MATQRTAYDNKDYGWLWYIKFNNNLINKLGFNRSKYDHTLYYFKDHPVMMTHMYRCIARGQGARIRIWRDFEKDGVFSIVVEEHIQSEQVGDVISLSYE